MFQALGQEHFAKLLDKVLLQLNERLENIKSLSLSSEMQYDINSYESKVFHLLIYLSESDTVEYSLLNKKILAAIKEI